MPLIVAVRLSLVLSHCDKCQMRHFSGDQMSTHTHAHSTQASLSLLTKRENMDFDRTMDVKTFWRIIEITSIYAWSSVDLS